MKKAFIDMDGVLCDWFSEFKIRAELFYNKKIKLEDIKGYDMHNYIDLDSEEINSIFSSNQFFKNLEPLKEAISGFNYISSLDLDVYIATKADTPDAIYDKFMWVKNNLVYFDTRKIIFISNKELLRGDIIIDDCPMCLENFKGTSVCFNQPYNKNCNSDYRVNNWLKCSSLISKLV